MSEMSSPGANWSRWAPYPHQIEATKPSEARQRFIARTIRQLCELGGEEVPPEDTAEYRHRLEQAQEIYERLPEIWEELFERSGTGVMK